MFEPRDLSSDDRRHFYRRAALAPLCLCLVAALQVTRVVWCNQTPWKGGGFGMFSTVDAESARFLRCYLITDRGDLPLAIPDALQKREAELRAAPTSAAAGELAQRLAGQRWRWRDDRQRRELASIRTSSGQGVTAVDLAQPNAASPLAPGGRGVGGEGENLHPGAAHELEPIPAGDSGLEAIGFTAVRVECWRYRFDARAAELRTEKLLTVSASREEAAQ